MSTADGTVLGTTQILGSLPPASAFNIVLLAEGFTGEEQSAFDTACTEFVAALLATPPFGDQGCAFNVYRVNVASAESGADDPVAAGGTGAEVRTYFDAQFGASGLRRLLVCNASTALQVGLAQVPEFSAIVVVVNSTIYGGSGGTVAVYSMAGGATEIALHEIGHSAFDLADEYPFYAGGAEPDREHHPGPEPTEPNVTTNAEGATLKWRAVVTPNTAIPTMANPNCATADTRPSPVPAGTVGLFEGAHYYHCDAYRPEYTCKMRDLGQPFCRVCRDTIAARITRAPGVPAPPTNLHIG